MIVTDSHRRLLDERGCGARAGAKFRDPTAIPPVNRRERRAPDDIEDGPCVCCERNPDRACPACAARRRRAVRLVVGQRLTLAEAAQAMALPVARVERLLEEDADQRTIERLVQTHVASAVLRDQFAVR